MSAEALFTKWDIPWGVTVALALAAVIYVRGWVRIRRTRWDLFPVWRMVAFLGGVVAIFVAVASPLDTFSESLLFMHMAQHFVLMSIAPPLMVLAAPVVPMLRGLPRAGDATRAEAAVRDGSAASGWSIFDAAERGMDRDECSVSWMAYSEGVRIRAGVGRMAQL